MAAEMETWEQWQPHPQGPAEGRHTTKRPQCRLACPEAQGNKPWFKGFKEQLHCKRRKLILRTKAPAK